MMKCPTCGGPLKPSKKDPDYLLCYTCKKKFKVPQHQAEDVATKTERMSAKKEDGRRDSAKKDSARKNRNNKLYNKFLGNNNRCASATGKCRFITR